MKLFTIYNLYREFLSYFQLPGESQKIDRIIECFARRYFEYNSEVFVNSGSIFLREGF